MKVYFTCSTAQFEEYKDNYFAIRDFLLKEGHILTRDWLMNAEERIQNRDLGFEDIKTVYRKCIEGIKKSNAVIIEDTVSNFSTGHQITIALQLKKPTLVLWHKTKKKHFNQMFIHGIESDYLQVKEYNKDNLEEIIYAFLRQFENAVEKNRFHLVLQNHERMYLDWAQNIKNESRTKVIRNALKTAIENDIEYQEYLKKHV